MSEELRSKLYDLERWENVSHESTQGLDFRLHRLEQIAEQTSTQLAVIHRFMAAASGLGNEEDDDDETESSEGSRDEDIVLARGDGKEQQQQQQHPPGSKSPIQTGAEKEMKQILERSASIRPKTDKQPGGNEGGGGGQLAKQDTLDSGEFEATAVIPDNPTTGDNNQQQQPSSSRSSATRTISFGGGARRKASEAGESSSSSRRRKQRHLSSGGSSTAPEVETAAAGSRRRPPSKRRPNKTARPRKATESSEEGGSASYRAMIGLHGQRTLSDEDEEVGKSDQDEAARPSAAANIYRRAQSEVSTTTSGLVSMAPAAAKLGRMMSVDVGAMSAAEETDSGGGGGDPSSLLLFHQQHRRKLSARHRMASMASTRDYTSITDELEILLPASVAAASSATPAGARAATPQPPAIKIEVETLHDAEETDFNLMETLIEKRLRRDSHNLEASLEDLVTKSILDTSSTTTGGEAHAPEPPPPASSAEVQHEERPPEVALTVEIPPRPRPAHSGGVRVRLAEDSDHVEVEFIDENIPATQC